MIKTIINPFCLRFPNWPAAMVFYLSAEHVPALISLISNVDSGKYLASQYSAGGGPRTHIRCTMHTRPSLYLEMQRTTTFDPVLKRKRSTQQRSCSPVNFRSENESTAPWPYFVKTSCLYVIITYFLWKHILDSPIRKVAQLPLNDAYMFCSFYTLFIQCIEMRLNVVDIK